MNVNPDRIRDLRTRLTQPRIPTLNHTTGSPVVYCMNRDQRANDNWALLYAQHIALHLRVPLHVVFCFDRSQNHGPDAAQQLMQRGLQSVSDKLFEHNISFAVLHGNRSQTLIKYLREQEACFTVTDFEPLRATDEWLKNVIDSTSLPIHQVDAHNIVPCWITSSKQEFGARTIRPKLNRLLPVFLEEFSPLIRHPYGVAMTSEDRNHVSTVNAATEHMHQFLLNIDRYIDRNDPTKNGQSGLSRYLHNGHISAQRIALEVNKIENVNRQVADVFLEELIVRRELSDNFTFYNECYDTFDGFPDWAQRTLNMHRADAREYTYEFADWESANTHDALWNTAQREMLQTGKMHGYMRMYWAKKILEWSATPELAFETAIALNDTYEVDGRDPNGYAGIAWSIGGVHDRPWFERPVFGSIRYMNANGCARKFDVNTYIRTYAETS